MRALVLCAGLGTRLGELVRDCPKPLLPLAGEPLLVHTLRWLARHGFRDVAINLHYRGDDIRAAIGDGSAQGVRVHYSPEAEPQGTAGAVRELGDWFDPAHGLLVVYGDLLSDQDLGALRSAHAEHDAAATLLVHQRRGSNSLLDLDASGRIRAFIERPDAATRAAHPFPWVNSGVQILGPRLLRHIPVSGPADLPRDVYTVRAGRERLQGVPLSGYRCAIDSPERYREAQAALAEGRCRGGACAA